MFVRRSRKGKIHVVRERVADGYGRLSKGLMRANKGVIDGVWSVHKGLQLGLAKGHQGVQSGLKTVQDFTGDFSMYQYQRTSYYQYEAPVAMFSMAEVDKFNKYGEDHYACFGGGYADFSLSGEQRQRLNTLRMRKDARAAGRAIKSAPGAVWKGVKGAAGAVKNAAVGGAGMASRGAVGGYNLARNAAIGGYGLASKGVQGGYGLAKGGAGMLGRGAGAGLGAIGGGISKIGGLAASRPALAGALLAGGAAAAAGGTMFMRRRRTKTGKVVVEQVRR